MIGMANSLLGFRFLVGGWRFGGGRLRVREHREVRDFGVEVVHELGDVTRLPRMAIRRIVIVLHRAAGQEFLGPAHVLADVVGAG